MADTIWGSVEFDALSRSFDYENYVRMHTGTGCRGALVSPEAYKQLNDVFYGEMSRSFERLQTDSSISES